MLVFHHINHITQSDLRCFKRESDSTVEVPYCKGGETDDPGKNYCTARSKRDDKLWLSMVGDNGVRDDGSGNPMLECEGDCDADEDCAVRQNASIKYAVLVEDNSDAVSTLP